MYEPEIGMQNVELLYFIERHDFITSPQLARMRGRTENGIRYLLDKLYRDDYLDKIRIKTEQAKIYPFQYFITKRAKDIICETLDVEPRKLIVRRNDDHKQIGTHGLYHNLGVNDFFSRVIAQCRGIEIPGLMLWANDRECCMNIPDKDDKIRPDGYGIIQTKESHVHFVLEYDRGSAGYQRDLSYKFLKYLKYAESEMYIYHFSFPRFDLFFEEMPKVLFLTVKERRAVNMKEYFEFVAEKEQLNDTMRSNYFLFSWESKHLMKDVLGDIWLRAGVGDQLIDILR